MVPKATSGRIIVSNTCPGRLVVQLRYPAVTPVSSTKASDTTPSRRAGDESSAKSFKRSERPISEMKRLVDIGDAEEKIGRALQETHIDVGHNGQRSDDGGLAVHGYDVTGPARYLYGTGKLAIIALEFAERVGRLLSFRLFAATCLRDHFVDRGSATLEAGRVSSLGAQKCIDGTIFVIEDVHFVVAVRLSEKNAEIRVDKIEVDSLVCDLEYGVIPPSDTLLLVQRSGDALIKGILEESTLTFRCSLVCRPARIGNNR